MLLEYITKVAKRIEQCTPASSTPQIKATALLRSGDFRAIDTAVRVETALSLQIIIDNPALAANLHSTSCRVVNRFCDMLSDHAMTCSLTGAIRIAAFLRSYGWLLIVTATVAVFQSLYVIAGTMPSRYSQLIADVTLPICFATWVQTDARIRRCTPFFDFGTFVLVIWSLAVPWYLIWTRGWRGLLVTLMFIGLWILPTIVARVVWTVIAIPAQ